MRQIPFHKHHFSFRERRAVARVLRSNWVNTGPETTRFLEDLKTKFNFSHGALFSSNTMAMYNLIQYLGFKPGDEVIAPVYTFTASIAPFVHRDLNLKLVDVGDDSPWIGWEKIHAKISERTVAILGVDYAGVCPDYQVIKDKLASSDVHFKSENCYVQALGRPLIISDSAHSLGTLDNNGQLKASEADFSVFSFHAVKNLTSVDGGLLTVNLNKKIMETTETSESSLQKMALFSMDKDAKSRQESGGWKYDVQAVTLKSNMTDILAAIGRVQLFRFASLAKKRRLQLRWYLDYLKTHQSSFKPLLKNGMENVFPHLFVLVCKNEDMRNHLMTVLKKNGVSANVHYRPISDLKAYQRELNLKSNDFPKAMSLYQRSLSLPIFHKLKKKDIRRICLIINNSI